MDGTIGEIRLFAGNFNPRTWQYCNGSLLSIAEYTTLYAIIGTTYGGDGQSTFGLPDLRGRIALGTGQGSGLPNVILGEKAGVENVTMLSSQMPGHTHATTTATVVLPTSSSAGNLSSADGAYLAGLTGAYAATANVDSSLAMVSTNFPTGVAGSSVPFSIVQPVLGLNYVICVLGVFPTRN